MFANMDKLLLANIANIVWNHSLFIHADLVATMASLTFAEDNQVHK